MAVERGWKCDLCPAAWSRQDLDRAAMTAYDLAHDGKPEAATARVLAPFAEAVEYQAPNLDRNARSLIGHLQPDPWLATLGHGVPEQANCASAVGERVVEEVAHRVAQVVGAAPYRKGVG